MDKKSKVTRTMLIIFFGLLIFSFVLLLANDLVFLVESFVNWYALRLNDLTAIGMRNAFAITGSIIVIASAILGLVFAIQKKWSGLAFKLALTPAIVIPVLNIIYTILSLSRVDTSGIVFIFGQGIGTAINTFVLQVAIIALALVAMFLPLKSGLLKRVFGIIACGGAAVFMMVGNTASQYETTTIPLYVLNLFILAHGAVTLGLFNDYTAIKTEETQSADVPPSSDK